LQFLVESLLLAIVGGSLGVALGASLSAILSAALELSLRVTLPYVALAVFVSSAVGILSGWYPASRASKLDPVAALGAE